MCHGAAAQWVAAKSPGWRLLLPRRGLSRPYFCIGGNDQLDTLPRGVSDNLLGQGAGPGRGPCFKDSRFGGDSTRVRTDVRDLDDWNDTISSVQVRRDSGNESGHRRGQPNYEPGHPPRLSGHPATGARYGRHAYHRTRMIDNGWTEQDVRQALQASADIVS